jgi:type II secretory ATPase GspE/PulE/Tfp pilus assembly ATPase PilB-like protein
MGPDIVGVANCEDSETAQVTAKAALDGKIVYVELKADNVVKTLGKWMKLVGDRNLALDGLIGISCQRLLRKLCEKCKEAYEPKKEVLRKFNLPAEKAKVLYRAGKVQYSKHGKPRTCENCQGTGFVGRTGVFEIIMIDDELRRSIKESKSLSEIDAQFKRAKMAYLQERALKNVIDGETAMNEVVQIFSKSKKKKEKPEQKT